MRHGNKTIRFSKGYDANRMAMKKLIRSFLLHSHVTTTKKRGRALKITLEKVLSKCKEISESHANYVMRYVPERKIVKVLFEQVGPVIKEIEGGYVRLVPAGRRSGDNSEMVRVEWAHPIVLDWKRSKKTSPSTKTIEAEKNEPKSKSKTNSKTKSGEPKKTEEKVSEK